MRLAIGAHFFALFVGNIGDDDAVYTAFFATGEEFFGTIGINRISIGQKYQWYLGFLTQLGHEVKDFVGSSASLQRTQIGTLNNGALGHGVGEGNAKFHNAHTGLHHGQHQLLSGCQIGVTGGDEADEQLFIFCKCLLNSTHVSPPPYSVRLQQRPCRHDRKY